MNIIETKCEPRVLLSLTNKNVDGLKNDNPEYYDGCIYIFEPSPNEFKLNEIFSQKIKCIPNSTSINAGCDFEHYPYVYFVSVNKNNKVKFTISCYYRLIEWNEWISLPKYLDEMTKLIKKEEFVISCELDEDIEDISLIITFHIDDDSILIGNILQRIEQILLTNHDKLIKKYNQDYLFSTTFKFPDEYKHQFIQYLSYFSKFLNDLGINCEINMSNSNNSTELLVKSSDVIIENDEIYTLLAAYLQLPSNQSPIIHFIDNSIEANVRFQQLLSVVDHLKSQLKLTEALISLKDTENNILKDKLCELVQPKISDNISDYWEPYEGFKIKPYKNNFIEIDIPLLINKAKKIITKT